MNFTISKSRTYQEHSAKARAANPSSFLAQPLVIKINRLSLFLVFFWFGILKVLSISPAETLVTHLHELTLASLMPIESFLLSLGLLECTIGLLWLFPRVTNLAFMFFIIQMFTTFLPLIYLPRETWQNAFVLTLTGQYIVKNLVLIASAYTVLCYMRDQKLS